MKKEAVKHPIENSEEFKEIIARPPHSLVQYGTGIISAVLVLLVLGSFLFRYPDIVSTKISTTYIEDGKYLALVKLSTDQAYKIKPGMQVNIRFDKYPQREYGILQGITLEKQLQSSEGIYHVVIEIPKNKLSTRKKVLILEPGMLGKADIIIEEIALFDRIFEPIKNIFAQR
jgi:hypothetical protein